MNSKASFRKWFCRIVLSILTLATVVVGVWIVIAGPITVYRIIRYGDTDIDDFSHYPGRRLEPSESPYHFSRSTDELKLSGSRVLLYTNVDELVRQLEANDTIAFLLIKDDRIHLERYFQGHEESSLSQSFSMAKSFTSTLIGMAIDDGYIEGVHQPITDFIPELEERGFGQVEIQHLLTMTSGSNYVENDNPFGEHVILNYTPDLKAEILSFRRTHEPGSTFRYKSGDNALLALALRRALGDETITEYTQRRLWDPLGMEHNGVWTIDHEDQGLEKTWCCLAASARDFAKLGRLYIQGGSWKGEALLSPSWVAQATQAQIPSGLWPEAFDAAGWHNYGYQWWLASEDGGDFFALGKDGQIMYLNPGVNLLIIRLGWSPGELSSSQWIELFQEISNSFNG